MCRINLSVMTKHEKGCVNEDKLTAVICRCEVANFRIPEHEDHD